MPARVAGIGQWLPERIRNNSAWPEDFGSDRKRSGGDRTLVDFNCVSAQEKTLCPRQACAHDLRVERDRLLAQRDDRP